MCHASAPLPSLRHANSAIPYAVERIVLRAMQKDPAARYPSARAMRAALLAALGGLQRAEASEHAAESIREEVIVPVAVTDQWRTLADALVQPAEPTEPAEELASDRRLPDLEEQAFVSLGAAAAFHAGGDISEDALFRLCAVLVVGMLLLLGIVILHGVV
jgi:hypothetical protein